AARGVEVLAEILEEHPDEERAERESQDGEEEKRLDAAHALSRADDHRAPVNTLVQALAAFGKSRARSRWTGHRRTGLPLTHGQTWPGRPSPPRRSRRLAQPPWHTSTSGQARQTSGSVSSSAKAAEWTMSALSRSRSASVSDRFGQ